jgi:actin-related protein 6
MLFFNQFVAGDTDLILTEAPMIPNSLRRVTDEQIFEEYGFRSLFSPSSAFLAMIGHRLSRPNSEFALSPCHVIVDCGYSSTTISLFLDEVRLNYATLRINAGGKLLTNYLKEMISYRYRRMFSLLQRYRMLISFDFSPF